MLLEAYMPVILPSILVLLLSATLFFIFLERRIWNKGICKKTGEPWRLFSHTRCGDRGYVTDSGEYCWISWPVDLEERRKNHEIPQKTS